MGEHRQEIGHDQGRSLGGRGVAAAPGSEVCIFNESFAFSGCLNYRIELKGNGSKCEFNIMFSDLCLRQSL
jgi:hypothetical protein